MDFVIYRDSWRRGGTTYQGLHGVTSLYTEASQRMCCLGQVCFQLGVPLQALKGKGYPRSVAINSPEFAQLLYDNGLANHSGDAGREGDTEFTRISVGYNDSELELGNRKEQRLKNLFVCAGHTLTFVDGVAPWFTEKAEGFELPLTPEADDEEAEEPEFGDEGTDDEEQFEEDEEGELVGV